MYFIAFAFLALKLIAPALCTYQTCESIFCGGKLLHLVQTEHIFPSQKDFLYMRAKYPQEKILADFEELWRTRMVGRRDKREMVGKFVRKNFEESQVLEGCVPEDWKRKNPLEKRVRSREAAMVVRRLHLLWPVHCRKVVSEAFTKSRQYSILPLPEPFFVASADDGEATITETYWHHKALLVSGMCASCSANS
ncbi:hypothetical protein AAG570_010215 [Ranatra chinensis]|uniref:Trehalase n=1 Tax=Ranatra chinensis TaxID=642074 RepID=A0ABD0YLW3_9HEMI